MKKLLVVALFAVLATPAFAAIQNVKVSGDITSTFLYRDNFDLGATIGSEDLDNNPNPVGLKKQNVFITQTRLRVDADLSDNVSTTVGIINERAWNAENTPVSSASGSTIYNSSNVDTANLDTNVQLYLASVTLREFLYSPLTLTVGRQVFNFGNGLILGDGGVNNQGTGGLQYVAQDLTERTAYDGVKAVLDYKPLTITTFYFKNNQILTNGYYASYKTSSDVYGINADYQLSDPMSTLLETYLFTRFNGDNNGTSFGGVGNGGPTDKGDTLYVPGLRVSTNPVKGLNVQGEVAWQLGNHPVVPSATTQEAEHRDAMAAQFLASYSLPVLDKYKPTVNAFYTYVSGDKNGTQTYGSDPIKSAKVDTAWDPFNENQGSGTIYNTLFPLSNMHILALGASANPLEDVTASFTWSGLWAAQRYSSTQNPLALFQPDEGTATISPAATSSSKKSSLGNEYDVNLTYNYTEDVTFGVSLGWYIPGSVFGSTANGGPNKDIASQALADVAVKF